MAGGNYSSQKTRPNGWALAAIAAIHVAVFYGLLNAFAPEVTQNIQREVLSTFDVTITSPPPPEPETVPSPDPDPDEGAAAPAGRKAEPKAVTAPEPKIRIAEPSPAPKARGTGSANSAGAAKAGTGTGAGGEGDGRGSGRGGDGTGGVPPPPPPPVQARGPSVRSGALSVGDFGTPPGGRQIRYGSQIRVHFTVNPDGSISNCRLVRTSPDPEANAAMCGLVARKIRFNPAIDTNGNPMAAPYGYKQDFYPQ